jgi:hypothetical protein
VTDWAKVPPYVMLYSPEHTHGHVMSHLVGPFAATTDSPLGHWGRVNADDLANRWGYSGWYWAPIINDVRIWLPNKSRPKPPPDEDVEDRPQNKIKRMSRGPWFDKEIRELARRRANLFKAGRNEEARHVGAAMRELLKVDKHRIHR